MCIVNPDIPGNETIMQNLGLFVPWKRRGSTQAARDIFTMASRDVKQKVRDCLILGEPYLRLAYNLGSMFLYLRWYSKKFWQIWSVVGNWDNVLNMSTALTSFSLVKQKTMHFALMTLRNHMRYSVETFAVSLAEYYSPGSTNLPSRFILRDLIRDSVENLSLGLPE